TASVEGQFIKVKGPKGALAVALHGDVAAQVQGSEVKIDPRADTKRARAMWGTCRSLLANAMTGVTKGFERRLEISGVGYPPARQEPAGPARLQPRYRLSDSGGHHDRGTQADRGRRHRRRPAEGRPRRRRNPRFPQARTL